MTDNNLKIDFEHLLLSPENIDSNIFTVINCLERYKINGLDDLDLSMATNLFELKIKPFLSEFTNNDKEITFKKKLVNKLIHLNNTPTWEGNSEKTKRKMDNFRNLLYNISQMLQNCKKEISQNPHYCKLINDQNVEFPTINEKLETKNEKDTNDSITEECKKLNFIKNLYDIKLTSSNYVPSKKERISKDERFSDERFSDEGFRHEVIQTIQNIKNMPDGDYKKNMEKSQLITRQIMNLYQLYKNEETFQTYESYNDPRNILIKYIKDLINNELKCRGFNDANSYISNIIEYANMGDFFNINFVEENECKTENNSLYETYGTNGQSNKLEVLRSIPVPISHQGNTSQYINAKSIDNTLQVDDCNRKGKSLKSNTYIRKNYYQVPKNNKSIIFNFTPVETDGLLIRNDSITFDIENSITLTDGRKYNLVGLTFHTGNHYVSHVKRGDVWYFVDDFAAEVRMIDNGYLYTNYDGYELFPSMAIYLGDNESIITNPPVSVMWRDNLCFLDSVHSILFGMGLMEEWYKNVSDNLTSSPEMDSYISSPEMEELDSYISSPELDSETSSSEMKEFESDTSSPTSYSSIDIKRTKELKENLGIKNEKDWLEIYNQYFNKGSNAHGANFGLYPNTERVIFGDINRYNYYVLPKSIVEGALKTKLDSSFTEMVYIKVNKEKYDKYLKAFIELRWKQKLNVHKTKALEKTKEQLKNPSNNLGIMQDTDENDIIEYAKQQNTKYDYIFKIILNFKNNKLTKNIEKLVHPESFEYAVKNGIIKLWNGK